MNCFRKHSWAFIMVVSIMPAFYLAKNMISYPLDYDFSCSYGVPFAIWETYSQNNMKHSRFVDGTYKVSAIDIRDRSARLNFSIDAIILLIIFYLLQKQENESRKECLLRKYTFVLTLLLALSLWASIFSSWEAGLYRFLYLAAVFLEILLISAAMAKGVIACTTRRPGQTEHDEKIVANDCNQKIFPL